MKRKLLTMLAFVMASSGLWAYTTNGQFNSYGVKVTEDTDNSIQIIELQEAGDFADFVTNGDYNTYCNSTKWHRVVFKGPMNDDDIAAIKTEQWEDKVWREDWNSYQSIWRDGNFQNCTVLDFSHVTTAIAPLIKYNLDYGNGPHCLVIWPVATNPTKAQLVQMYNLGGTTDFAYYTENKEAVLHIPSKFAASTKFDVLIDGLATLENNVDVTSTTGAKYVKWDALEFAYSWSNQTTPFYASIHQDNTGSAAPAFFTKLSQVPFKSINFQGLNLSSLGNDFSNLNNAATNYVIVPVNEESYSAANDWYFFTWPNNIYVVGAYASTESPYGKGGSMDGANYAATKDPSANSITMTYVHVPGKLAGGAPYLPTVMQTADKTVIAGELNAADIEAIDHMTSPYIDLNKATLSSGVSITSYVNTSTKCIAVPNNTRPEEITTLYNTLKTNTGFLGVVGFTTQALAEDGTNRAVPTNTLITYTAQQGAVYNMVYMIEETNNGEYAGNVKNLIMSGQLNAYDIAQSISDKGVTLSTETSATDENGVSYTMVLGSDGHLHGVSEKTGLPDGVTAIAGGALNGATVDLIDFTNAIFDQPTISQPTACTGYYTYEEKLNFITDMNPNALGLYPSELLLPTDASQKVIPPFFVSQGKNHYITEICIPYNFQYIMDGAFNLMGSSLRHIYTTAPATVEGLIDSEADHAVERDETTGEILGGSYTIGANVKYIGTAAFDTNDATNLKDVYVLSKNAPTCEPNAFCSSSYMGNNGFKGAVHPICRDNYVNGDNHWIAILHFPNSITDAQKKKYTDIDREYYYTDETGAVDGEGNLIQWPAHTEFLRSYNQARYGYTWNEWRTERTGAPGWGNYGEVIVTGPTNFTHVEDPTLQTVAETVGDNGETIYIAGSGTESLTDKHAICTGEDACGFTSYIGWHQFLLAQPGYFYEVESTVYVPTGWYTFCIPFDMTFSELQKYLGVPAGCEPAGGMPDVRTLIAVKRNQSTHHIDIVISKNLVELEKDIKTYGQLEGDAIYQDAEYVKIERKKDGVDVYLKGGYPYFVKGWVPQGESIDNNWGKNLGRYVMANADFNTEDLGNVVIINPNTVYDANNKPAPENILSTKMWESTDEYFVAMPYLNHTVDAKSVESDGEKFYGKDRTVPAGIDEDQPYLYTFVGNFEQQDFMKTGDNNEKNIPGYVYYMNNGTIYRNASHTDWLWKPYICMIGHGGTAEVVQVPIAGINTFHSAYNGVLNDKNWGKNEFKEETLDANAGTFALVFEEDIIDGEATQITNLNGEEIIPVGSAVYNLNGQYVGNSLNGLAKGVYVVNGKKFVVK